MSKKIDVNDYVGKTFKNKIDEEYYIDSYLFKEKNNHCFDIEFLETKNKQMATLNQIRKGTCIDLIQRKKMKRIQTELKLKERNKLIKQNKNKIIIPDNLKEKNVLSVDLATKSVGVAYSQKGKIVRWKTIVSDLNNFRDRGCIIVDKIVEMLNTGLIDTVILEDTYLGLNSNILSMLSEVRGMLTYHIKKNNLELLVVPPIFWKNKFKDLPASRKEQKEFMMRKFFEYTGVEADSDDIADAYMMLKACLN